MVDANVAMLIDYENVGLDAIDHLLDQLSDVGRVIIRRAYGDWSVQRGKQDQLLDLGIEPIHQYHSNKSGKNSSDIRLVIEAIDLLHSSPIDSFVIVSSDSDFVPLVGRLRSAGKSVIVAGRREATSPTLIKSCDRFIFLDDAEPAVAQNAVSRRRATPSRRGTQTAARTPTPDPKSLLLRAMNASMDEEGSVVGSKLYQTMRRIEPSFNYKDLRHRIFTQFLDSYSDVVDVIRPKDGSGDVIVQIHGSREQPRTAARRNGRGRQSAAEPADQPATTRSDSDHRSPSRRRTPLRYQPDDGGVPTIQRNPPQPPPQPVILPPVPPEDIESEVAKAADAAEAKKEAEASVVPAVKEIKEAAQPQAPQQDDAPAAAGDPVQAATWAEEVNAAWHRRDKDRIAGRVAAMDAAKALGARKLSVSEYPSLEKLLEASTLLQLNWRRDGNAIIRK